MAKSFSESSLSPFPLQELLWGDNMLPAEVWVWDIPETSKKLSWTSLHLALQDRILNTFRVQVGKAQNETYTIAVQ